MNAVLLSTTWRSASDAPSPSRPTSSRWASPRTGCGRSAMARSSPSTRVTTKRRGRRTAAPNLSSPRSKIGDWHEARGPSMTKRTLLTLGAMAVCLATPASAQNREHQQMAAELRMLQEQSQQLAITLTTLNQALAESIKALNARLEDSNNAMKKAFADQRLLIDNMARDVGVARERAGDTNVRITSLQEEVEALRATVQAFQQSASAAAVAPPLDPNTPVDPNAPAPVTPAPVSTTPLPSAAGLSPTRLFETARADFFAG